MLCTCKAVKHTSDTPLYFTFRPGAKIQKKEWRHIRFQNAGHESPGLFHVKRDRSSPLEILRLAFAKVYFKDNIARIFGCISTTGYSHERTPPNEKLYFRESKVAESKLTAPGAI